MSSDHTHPCTVHCGRSAEGYLLCRWCGADLAAMLHTMPWLLRQLRVNETRRSRYSEQAGASDPTAVHALPYDPGAAQVRHAVTTALDTWARDVSDRTGRPYAAYTAETAADWLRTQLQAIRLHPAAAELHNEITRLTGRAYRVIDRPQGRIYVGPCGALTPEGTCGEDLYARADSSGTRLDPRQATVRCGCGAEWDAEKRRDWLLGELRDTLATAREIASAVGMLAGRTISAKTIRTWANRGQIPSHYPPGGGPARHPIGEVVDYAATRARAA